MGYSSTPSFFCIKRFCHFNSSPLRTKGVFGTGTIKWIHCPQTTMILFKNNCCRCHATRRIYLMLGFCMSFNIVVLNTFLQIVQRTLKRTTLAICLKYESNIMSPFTISQLYLLLKLDCCLCVFVYVCLFICLSSLY